MSLERERYAHNFDLESKQKEEHNRPIPGHHYTEIGFRVGELDDGGREEGVTVAGVGGGGGGTERSVGWTLCPEGIRTRTHGDIYVSWRSSQMDALYHLK